MRPAVFTVSPEVTGSGEAQHHFPEVPEQQLGRAQEAMLPGMEPALGGGGDQMSLDQECSAPLLSTQSPLNFWKVMIVAASSVQRDESKNTMRKQTDGEQNIP